MKAVLTIMFALVLAGSVMASINDFDCTPYSPGFYLQGYPMFSTASKLYDNNGDTWDMGDSWNMYGVGLRPTYYGMLNERRWAVSAFVPVISNSPAGGNAESGIGDVTLSATYWVLDDHQKGNYFSVWFWTDLPVGDDEKGLGTGQANFRPGIAYAMDRLPWNLQASAYYNMRFENSSIDTKPGNEFWANANFGYGVNPQFTPGLELQTGFGQDWKYADVTQTDTKNQWVKLGPSFTYQINPNVGLKFLGTYNVVGKMTPQSFDLWGRITWSFAQ